MERTTVHWAWVVLATCFFNLFINYSIRLGYGTALPEMIKALDITRTQGGMIYNSYLIVYIILSPFAGKLTDRIGARAVITLFCILLGTGTFLMGTVEQFWTACLFYALVGAGASAMWTPVLALVQRWFGMRRRGMALGLVSTGYGLGFATTGKLFPLIVAALNWRYCWFFLGLAALVMVVANAFLLRSKPEDMGMHPWGEGKEPVVPAPSRRVAVPYSRTLGTQRFWLIGISYFFIAASLYMITTFIVDYANLELGIPYDRAASVVTVHGLCQVLGVLTIPMLSDYIGRRTTLLSSNLILACATTGIMLVGTNLSLVYIMVGIIGVFYGITFPMYGACAGDYFPREVMGTVIGMWTTCYGVGAIIGHLVAGRIRDVSQSFHPAFVVAVICAAMAALLMSLLRQPTGVDREV
jgi:sugar phosphate permease